VHDPRNDDINRQQHNTTFTGGTQGPENVKPASVQGDLHHLPAALAPLIALPHWVCWRWGKTKAKNGEEKWTKVPYQPDGRHAKNNDPTTWSNYKAVMAVVDKFDGIGFCLLNGNIAAFDIDHCRDAATGVLDPWAIELVKRADSYSEITVSGTGLRIIGFGDGPRLQRKLPVHDGVTLEAYRNTERYIVVTGNPLPESKDITNIDEHLDKIVAELEAKKGWSEQNKPGSPEDGGHHARYDPGKDEQEGGKLERIIRYGESGEFNGDRSSAVWFVICEMLRRGYVDIVIMSTLLDKTNRISDHIYEQKEPGVYAKRQITKAREKIKPAHVEVLPASQWFGEKPAPIPPALIKGLLPETGVATIGGQSGGGKSSHAIHLATRLIPDCDQQFYIDQYRIKRHGGVLYLVLEGIPSFPLRVTAAFEEVLGKQMKLGERSRLPFAWNSYSPNLFEKGPDALLKLAAREAQKMRQDFGVDLVAVILDTMGLAACYENEDKSAQVLRVLGSHLHRLSDETGALAIDVDHMGKDQDAGLRGTSAKRDAPETILACLLDRDKNNRAINHRMQLFKVRDGEEGRIIPYRLKPIDMGRDEDGDPVSTCVIQWEPLREQPMKGRQPPKKKQTDVNLERAIKEVGLPADVEKLRAAFYRYHGGNAHAANAAWNRAVNNKLDLDEDGRLDNAKE
jgi:hypothetical protein